MKKLFSLALVAGTAGLASADIIEANISWFPDAISSGLRGDINNTFFNIDLSIPGYTSYRIVALAWDVSLFANSPSKLSEMRCFLTESTNTTGVFIQPGFNDPVSGAGNYSVPFVELGGGSFDLGSDGILRMEFCEGLDNSAVEPDGRWLFNGVIGVRYDASTVPEPATLAVLGVGALAMVKRRRR